MLVERRKITRNRCLLGAYVVFDNRRSTRSCTIRNYSEDGALLKFGEMPFIPDQLELVLDNRSTMMPVRIAWTRDNTVGISFPRGRFMEEMRDEAAKKMASFQATPAGTALH